MLRMIAAITLVFVFTAFAWMFLGATVRIRTDAQDASLRQQVGNLWGEPQRQRAPTVEYLTTRAVTEPVPQQILPTGAPHRAPRPQAPPPPRTETVATPVGFEASDIAVALDLEHRSKGLLWYSTYRVRFDGSYVVANDSDAARDYRVTFMLPVKQAIYDNFSFTAGGREIPDLEVSNATVSGKLRIAPGERETVRIAYGSQGLDEWWYEFGPDATQIKNFSLAMRTNFDEIDFPGNAISPSAKVEVEGGGWDLRWDYGNLLSGIQIGMAMPQRLNPGPWVSEITFFAPVSLFFFFFLLFISSMIQRVPIHPMNYFFVATGFFAFHLLLAYLVDHVSIHVAFGICSAVSLALVISYMRLVVGNRFAITYVGISQLVYLVLFSYTFFFEKYTGLAITVMAIVTQFIVMQVTGRIDWARLTRGPEPPDHPMEREAA